MKISAVIVAGGKGKRMGAGRNKVFLKLCGREIIEHTVEAFENDFMVDEIIIVTGAEDVGEMEKICSKFSKIKAVVIGGAQRQQSVYNGIRCASGDIVLIHDGARALVTEAEINNSIAACIKYGAAAAGVKCKDTLKSTDENGFITGTIDRETSYHIQTPQTFYRDEILSLHERSAAEGFAATDDCMIAERYGVKIKISEGSYENIKLTTPEDIITAERILSRRGKAVDIK